MKFNCIPKIAGRHFVPLATLVCTLSFHTMAPSVADASAEIRYVKPTAEVAVRRGQGSEYKIIGMVKDGERVDFLEESGSYARIRFGENEGWMLKRYLSAEPPLDEVVESLKKERDQLEQVNMEVSEKAQQTSTELSRIKADLDTVLAERDEIMRDYQNLKNDTANVVEIKNDLERVTAENEKLQNELSVMGEENRTLKKEAAINWFLAGAGVFLVGLLLGRLPGPSRRRKSSLL